MVTDRVTLEYEALKTQLPAAELHESNRWVYISGWLLPPGMWSVATLSLCVEIPPNYPGQAPYGFFVSPHDLTLANGATPQNAKVDNAPPYSGIWLKFSWSANDWHPAADHLAGSNLLNFVNSVRTRLSDGK